MRYNYLILLPLFALAHLETARAEETVTAEPLIVTASKVEQTPDKIGNAVTVLTRKELERRGDRSVADALSRTPGVSLSRNGGFGASTSVRIRGTNTGQTVVLIDGVNVGDAATADNAFDFSTLLVSDVERIEVLRGSQSALYGSDAIGGVINIITRQNPDGKTHVSGFVEGGSFGTGQGNFGARGGDKNFYYGASATGFHSDGFSRSKAGKELDSTNVASVRANVGGQVTEKLKLDFSGGYIYSESQFDPSATTDGPGLNERDFAYGLLTAEFWASDIFKNTFKAGGNMTDREFDEPAGFFRRSTFEGTRLTAGYQGDIYLRDRDVLTFGADYQLDDANTTNTSGGGVTTQGIDRDVYNRSIFGQYLLGLGENVTITAGVRHDDHQQFGEKTTGRGAIAYNIPQSGTILRASAGSGFKAPSLFQLYAANFGNPNLEAEESFGYDFGFEQKLFGDIATLNMTYFNTEIENQIDFDFATFSYLNTGEASSEGVETVLDIKASESLSFQGTHTYTNAQDDTTGLSLLRRPRNVLTFATFVDVTEKARFTALGRYVSKQQDSGSRVIKSFFTADVQGEYDLTDQVTWYGRIENLLDRDYVEVSNYNTPGFSLYSGLRFKY